MDQNQDAVKMNESEPRSMQGNITATWSVARFVWGYVTATSSKQRYCQNEQIRTMHHSHLVGTMTPWLKSWNQYSVTVIRVNIKICVVLHYRDQSVPRYSHSKQVGIKNLSQRPGRYHNPCGCTSQQMSWYQDTDHKDQTDVKT